MKKMILLSSALLTLFIVDLATAQPYFLDPINTHPVVADLPAPNTWYIDRYKPAGFQMSLFDGGNRLLHSISTSDAALNRPEGQQGSFYNTHGRKFDIHNVNNTSIEADLYIGTNWQTTHRRADIWATGFDATNTVSAYPIIGFANTTGSNPTFRTYNSNDGTWQNISMPIIYGQWYNLKIELKDNLINYYINDNFVSSYVPDPPITAYLGNFMLQAYNFGDPTLPPEQYALESYDVYWDNVGAITKIKNETTGNYSLTIQSAIDEAVNGNIINIYPGNYYETASGRFIFGTANGPHQFGLFIDKDNLTIRGVKSDGSVITTTAEVATLITTNSTANFGPSGIFVQGANVTLQGLGIGDNIVNNVVTSNKTIEIIGNSFIMNTCVVNTSPDEGAIYFGRWDDTHPLDSYSITNNLLNNSLVSINNGVGVNGLNSSRLITGNTFTGLATPYLIGFRGWNGPNPAQGWILFPVGGAIVTGNSFNNPIVDKYIVARGNTGGYDNSELDWSAMWNNNTYGNHVVTLETESPFAVRFYNDGTYPETRRISQKIQENITESQSGDVVLIGAGTYEEPAQIDIIKSIKLLGVSTTSTIVKPGFNTTAGGNIKSESFIYIDPLASVVMKNFAIDCGGKQVNHAIQSRGTLDIENCIIQNVKWGTYAGRGIVYYGGTSNNVVKNVSMNNIERIGIHVRGNVMTPNPIVSIANFTYTGKGIGDWLDYGIEFGGGGIGTVDNANISNCKGVATADLSTSAGILVTDYFGTGTNAIITNSTLSNNTTGMVVGYGVGDNSIVVAHNNNIVGNTAYGITSINPPVNAENNWWGTAIESEILSKINGPVDYDPWIGKAETVTVDHAAPVIYDFPGHGVKMVFNTLPTGGGTVTAQRFYSVPTGFPALPAGATHAGLWFNFSSSMPNYSFNATITIDVTGLGFSTGKSIMYFNAATNSWVAVTGGIYAGGAIETYTFTTNHFTPFSFINTPGTAYNVYLSSSTSAASGFIYPNVNWGMPAPLPIGYPGTPVNDWDFTTPIELYVVPQFGSVFGASDITIQWDNTMFSYVGVSASGGIYDNANSQFISSQTGNELTINAGRFDNTNVTIGTNDFIAKLNLNLLKPGFAPVNFTALDFRAFNGGGGQLGVYVTGNNAQVKSYLGDVASTSPASVASGDGFVNFDDLNPWATSYWSGVGSTGMANYKVKYDVGPTTTNTVYGLPTVDAKIQFEDFVIFAMSYGLSASHVYPKLNAQPTAPVELQLGDPVISGNQTRVPLFVSGGVQNVRAMNLTFAGTFGKLVSVEKGTLLNELVNPVMVMSNVEGNQVFVDLAVFGANELGISNEGEVITLIFEGNADIKINTANIRNILNGSMAVNISGSVETVPTEFALMQNYPNPFNPSTMINYSLPTQSMVEISVFNALGEKVATLVNELKEAGRYSVELNAGGFSSGIYFYQITANDFVSVKKMILMK